jgi:hypothetical protein
VGGHVGRWGRMSGRLEDSVNAPDPRDGWLAAPPTKGSIVTRHLGHPDTVAALADILHELDRRGVHLVTATQLMP